MGLKKISTSYLSRIFPWDANAKSGTVMQLIAVSLHTKVSIASFLGPAPFYRGFCMFSLCLRGSCLDTLASSHSPKACKLGVIWLIGG